MHICISWVYTLLSVQSLQNMWQIFQRYTALLTQGCIFRRPCPIAYHWDQVTPYVRCSLCFQPWPLHRILTWVHLHIDFSDEMAQLWSHSKGGAILPAWSMPSRMCSLRAQAAPESYWSSLAFPHSQACDQASYQLLPAVIVELISEPPLNPACIPTSPSANLSGG